MAKPRETPHARLAEQPGVLATGIVPVASRRRHGVGPCSALVVALLCIKPHARRNDVHATSRDAVRTRHWSSELRQGGHVPVPENDEQYSLVRPRAGGNADTASRTRPSTAGSCPAGP